MNKAYTTFELLVAALCCLGNVLVIWGVKMTCPLKQPTFCFVVSLAVADFLVGAVAIPMAILLTWELQMSFGGCLFISCVVLILTQSSVLALLAIAMDRYLRVHMALRYRRIATQSRSWAAVIASWVIACMTGLTPLFGWNNAKNRPKPPNSTIICQFVNVMSMDYMVYFNFFGFILIPLLLMVVLYLMVFYYIRKHLRDKESQTFYMKEQKLAKSLVLVLALFALCWLPLHSMNCITFFTKFEIPSTVLYMGIILSHANSAVNPIIYAFKIRKLRRAYIQIWKRLTHCQASELCQGDGTSDQADGSNRNSTISNDNRKVQLPSMPKNLNTPL